MSVLQPSPESQCVTPVTIVKPQARFRQMKLIRISPYVHPARLLYPRERSIAGIVEKPEDCRLKARGRFLFRSVPRAGKT
nr:hypothetical protein [Methanospirillum sp.]